MYQYKILYSYTNTEEGRIKAHDYYNADTAQEAVDNCREDFYITNELQVEAVYIRTYYGWELDECWM